MRPLRIPLGRLGGNIDKTLASGKSRTAHARRQELGSPGKVGILTQMTLAR